MIPTWLADHLRAIGADNPDGVTRAARIGSCRRCQADVIRGLDGDLAAWSATADVAEIDEYGEYLALLAHRMTYNLVRYSGRWELNGRGFSQLRHPRRSAVVPAHRCGARIPITTDPWLETKGETRSPASIDPPF